MLVVFWVGASVVNQETDWAEIVLGQLAFGNVPTA
jgi:hypothetical protein